LLAKAPGPVRGLPPLIPVAAFLAEPASRRSHPSREFRSCYDEFQADGETKGINFSLSVAIELARRMTATARDTSNVESL